MRPLGYVLLASMLAACGEPALEPDGGPVTRDGGDPTPDSGAHDPDDAGRTEADGGHDVDAGPPDAGSALEVLFTAPPPTTTHVRDTVNLQFVVRGGTPDEVELWKDGSILVVLTPPYTYAWDTGPETEAAHTLEARAIRGGMIAGRAERTFVVDRTPPTIVSRTPVDGATTAALADPIRVEFSEPIRDTSVTGAFALELPGGPLAHALSQPEPHVLTAQVSVRPDPLPATATVTVAGTITDLAGNALGADDTWSFTYPTWADRTGPIITDTSASFLDAAIAPDATVWVLFKSRMSPPYMEDLRLAAWDGASWTEVASPSAGADGIGEARVRVRASGTVVIVWQDARGGSGYTLRVSEWDGTAWVDLASPPRSAEYSSGLDAEIEDDGGLVVSRRIDLEYAVHRYRGTWSAVGSTFTASSSYDGRTTDLLPTPEGLYLTYQTNWDCMAVREDVAGWTVPTTILSASSETSRCDSALLARSSTGTLLAYVNRRLSRYPYGSDPGTLIRSFNGSYWEYPDSSSLRYSARSWINTTPTSTGAYYVLGSYTFPSPTQGRVVDETITELEGGIEDAARVLSRAGEPIVVVNTGAVLEINDLP